MKGAGINLEDLIARVEALEEPDGHLDRLCALALGWTERKVTGLGLNGRTPGRWLWVSEDDWKPRRLPRFTGPRTKAATLAKLRALSPKDQPL